MSDSLSSVYFIKRLLMSRVAHYCCHFCSCQRCERWVEKLQEARRQLWFVFPTFLQFTRSHRGFISFQTFPSFCQPQDPEQLQEGSMLRPWGRIKPKSSILWTTTRANRLLRLFPASLSQSKGVLDESPNRCCSLFELHDRCSVRTSCWRRREQIRCCTVAAS